MASALARTKSGGETPPSDVYHQIVTDMADAVVGMDRNFIIRMCNPAAETLFGWTSEEMIGQPIDLLIPERFHGAHSHNVQSFRDTRASARYMGNRRGFILGRTRSGAEICLGATILNTGSMREPLMVAIIRDLTERQEHQGELQRLANTDPLSGALNRRAFQAVSETELHNSRQRNHPTSLILFDIDHFKSINDMHGHQTGDQVICAFTELLRSSLRSNDILGRWGGEEFIVLLPSASLDQACHVGERIRRAVEEWRFEHGMGPGLKLTTSAGVTHAHENETLDGFFRRADLALYAAKANGRNRIFLFGFEHSDPQAFAHSKDHSP